MSCCTHTAKSVCDNRVVDFAHHHAPLVLLLRHTRAVTQRHSPHLQAQVLCALTSVTSHPCPTRTYSREREILSSRIRRIRCRVTCVRLRVKRWDRNAALGLCEVRRLGPTAGVGPLGRDGMARAGMDKPLKREDTGRYKARHPFVAGALTGGLEIMVTFPFEFIKVQLQLQHHYKLNAFHGPFDCALYTLRHKGPLGLYKGLSPWLIFAFPRSAVRFSTFEYVSQYLQDDNQKLRPLNSMMAGTIAGSMEFLTVGTPMSCLQIKMAHDAWSATPKFRGTFDAFRQIVAEEGFWRGMYGGVGPTVLKGGVNNCIRFLVFHELKHVYAQVVGRDAATADGEEFVLKPGVSLLIGAAAGGLSAVATHPIDTVKSNMQALKGGGYRNSWHCITEIIKASGVRGLYKGLLPRFIRVCMEIGLQFSLYEMISKELDRVW